MSKVIAGFSMSLDGFVADPDHGVDQVFKWYSAGGTDAEVMAGHGTFEMSREGAEYIEEAGKGAGVLVTARRTFDLAHAWGGKHPMDVPMVVVTHRVPEEWANREGSPFTFVTGGVPEAVDVARRSPATRTSWSARPASPGSACNSGSSMPSTSTSRRWCWDAGYGSSIT